MENKIPRKGGDVTNIAEIERFLTVMTLKSLENCKHKGLIPSPHIFQTQVLSQNGTWLEKKVFFGLN